MSSEAVKVAVPESVFRKRKREEQWAAEKKEKSLAERKKSIENRKLIFTRAKQYAEEYDAQVRSPDPARSNLLVDYSCGVGRRASRAACYFHLKAVVGPVVFSAYCTAN